MSGNQKEALYRQMLDEDKKLIESVTRITEKPLGRPALVATGYESRFKIGDDVKVEGKVTAVYFHEYKVKYVIKVSEHICIEMDSCDVHPKDAA
jgi:hypothetical protein